MLAYSKHLDAEFTGTGPADTSSWSRTSTRTVRETIVHLDPQPFGPARTAFTVPRPGHRRRAGSGGADDYVRLDPFAEPVHILVVVPSLPPAALTRKAR